ncbi:MAG: type III-A CRISPR-associated protein Cas10/Csm1 [Deltaproteobacteria bacterium]|nr:MAG: type III-A CRISPR-associated protein Cas10/Csm1 [Deltaproteobacteria bacterium]
MDTEGKDRDEPSRRIEMNPLGLAKDIIFPKNKAELDPEEGELLTKRYDKLWEGFSEAFGRLPKANFLVFTETLLFLLEKYTWCIPGSTTDLPDVSLYDHSKTTAAIAGCLYDYHDAMGSMTIPAIRDKNDQKFLLVCGDVSGIQKFIYNITAKGAAKGLKGRSFLVQLIAEAAGKHILRQFGYSVSNMLYSGGGRFYLLLANRDQKALDDIRAEINATLLEKYDGDVCLALGWTELCGNNFSLGKAEDKAEKADFPSKWRDAAIKANEDKRRKFAGLDYQKVFGPSGQGGEHKTCQICKKEGPLKNVSHGDENVALCRDCEIAERMGQELSKASWLAEVYNEQTGLKGRGFDIPIPNTRYYLFKDSERNHISEIRGEAVGIYRLNDTDFLPENGEAAGSHVLGFKFTGGVSQSISKNFGELTNLSTGLKRLGILRMDVDNLGQIFMKGLGKRASISRIAGLSYQLSLFFSGYLNMICNREKTMIIYSGGDDLFIVGAWDNVVELAGEIQREFKAFACENDAFTISGGIAMVSEKYPIYRGAAHAGDAEEKAKTFKRSVGGQQKEKNALTFLNKPLGWDDLAVSRKIKDKLHLLIKDGKAGKKLPAGILNRLREIYLLYERNRQDLEEKQEVRGAELEEKTMYNKWMWRAVYTLKRMAGKNPLFRTEILELRDALIKNRFHGEASERPIIQFIDVPTRWAEFLVRKQKENENGKERQSNA